jgi:hypothetical protein
MQIRSLYTSTQLQRLCVAVETGCADSMAAHFASTESMTNGRENRSMAAKKGGKKGGSKKGGSKKH